MDTIKHSPAPWKTGEASWNEDGDVRYTLHGIKEAKVTDARLIEAAPVMYDLLYRVWLTETAKLRDVRHYSPEFIAEMEVCLGVSGATP